MQTHCSDQRLTRQRKVSTLIPLYAKVPTVICVLSAAFGDNRDPQSRQREVQRMGAYCREHLN